MSRKQKDKFYANEEFLKKAKAEGRVRRVRLPIAGLKVDYKHYQPRVVHLDMDHVRDLGRILMDDDADGNPTELEPIIVFEFKDGTRIPADGFHRIGAYKKAGRDVIPCDVIAKGTKQETIEFAASCNQRALLKRTREDVYKAVAMLFDNGWFERADGWIARQIGCSTNIVAKVRSEYAMRNNLGLPDVVVKENGGTVRRKAKPGTPSRHGRQSLICSNGTTYRSNEAFVAASSHRESGKLILEHTSRTITWLARRGVHATTPPASGSYIRCLFAGRYAASFCTADRAHTSTFGSELIHAAGRALYAAAAAGLAGKVVLTPDSFKNYQDVVEIIRRLGVEFMTLDEFVAAVKADEAEQPIDDDTRAALEQAGYVFGDAEDFFGLDEEERRLVSAAVSQAEGRAS